MEAVVSDTRSLHNFFEKISQMILTFVKEDWAIFFAKFVTFSENMNKKTLPLGWDKVEEVIGGGGGCCIRCPEAGGC